MFRLVTDALLQRDKQTKWPVWQLSSAGNAHLQRDSCDKSLLPWHEPRAKRYTLSHPHTYAQCVVRCSWVRMDLHLNLCLPKFTSTHLCLCLPKFVQQIRPNDNRLCPYHSLPSPRRDEAPHLYSFWEITSDPDVSSVIIIIFPSWYWLVMNLSLPTLPFLPIICIIIILHFCWVFGITLFSLSSCSRVLCEAGLSLQQNTRNHTQGVQEGVLSLPRFVQRVRQTGVPIDSCQAPQGYLITAHL